MLIMTYLIKLLKDLNANCHTTHVNLITDLLLLIHITVP